MTWTETRNRWRAMREIEEQVIARPEDGLPWREEYAELFGDRAGLIAALRYRNELARSTQLDTHAPEVTLDESRRALLRRTRALQIVLAQAAQAAQATADDAAVVMAQEVSRDVA